MVKIERSGEVIPKITEVYFGDDCEIREAELPSLCPCCGHNLEKRGVDLVCTNQDCVGKLKVKLRLMNSREALEIVGLGEETVEILVDKGFISTLGDIFSLKFHSKELIELDGMGEKSVSDLLSNIESAAKKDLPSVITSLCIKDVGPKIAKLIAQKLHPQGIMGLILVPEEDLLSIDGVGPVISKNILSFIHSTEECKLLYIYTYNGVGQINTCKPIVCGALNGKTFVVTGTLSKERKLIEQDIVEAGGKVSSSCSSKTSYLVCGDNPGSSKVASAEKHSISMIDEQLLYEMINNVHII
ncbi:DNA ligase [Lachnospiraceae bacterium KM106-2]|nr:DNA ligase [Lachnospiraceae bacterium KM106-2]